MRHARDRRAASVLVCRVARVLFRPLTGFEGDLSKRSTSWTGLVNTVPTLRVPARQCFVRPLTTTRLRGPASGRRTRGCPTCEPGRQRASERLSTPVARGTQLCIRKRLNAGEDARMRLVLEMVDMGAVTGWCEMQAPSRPFVRDRTSPPSPPLYSPDPRLRT
jgi:hypothetical protein